MNVAIDNSLVIDLFEKSRSKSRLEEPLQPGRFYSFEKKNSIAASQEYEYMYVVDFLFHVLKVTRP